MALIDTYRSNVIRKREAISKLVSDKAKESDKIAKARAKIDSANNAIKRTHSTTTIKSKMNEIARAEKEITVAEKKIADMERYNTREYIRESSPVTNLVFSMVCEKFDNKI